MKIKQLKPQQLEDIPHKKTVRNFLAACKAIPNIHFDTKNSTGYIFIYEQIFKKDLKPLMLIGDLNSSWIQYCKMQKKRNPSNILYGTCYFDPKENSLKLINHVGKLKLESKFLKDSEVKRIRNKAGITIVWDKGKQASDEDEKFEEEVVTLDERQESKIDAYSNGNEKLKPFAEDLVYLQQRWKDFRGADKENRWGIYSELRVSTPKFLEEAKTVKPFPKSMEKAYNQITKVWDKWSDKELKDDEKLRDQQKKHDSIYKIIQSEADPKKKLFAQAQQLYRLFFDTYKKLPLAMQYGLEGVKDQMKTQQQGVFDLFDKHYRDYRKGKNPRVGEKVKNSEGVKVKVPKNQYRDVTKNSTDPNIDVKAITELFVNGADPRDVTQGDVGNCYFLSALAAVAKANPKAIESLVKDKGDGTYDVKLYVRKKKFLARGRNLKPVVVNVTPEFPVDEEGNPIFAQSETELWVMLVEKAFAELNGNSYKKTSGGWSEEAMENITGKASQAYEVNQLSNEEIYTIINDALADGRPITASTREKKVVKRDARSGASKTNMDDLNKYESENWAIKPKGFGAPKVDIGVDTNHVFFIRELQGDKIFVGNPHNIDTGSGKNLLFTLQEFRNAFDLLEVEL